MSWRKLLVAALVLALSGCGLGPRSSNDPVTLTVTRDFGAATVVARAHGSAGRNETALDLLRAHASVVTSGSGQVETVDGLSATAGRTVWQYFVNGIAGTKPPDQASVNPGDVVSWDYHSTASHANVSAIVGAFPEPFVHGLTGERLPTRVECDNDASAACQQVRESLSIAGGLPAGASLGSIAGQDTLRVVVGRWSALSQIQSAATLEAGPSKSGVFARFDKSGTALVLLDGEGRPARTAGPGSGLLAATLQPGQALVWLVTGVDEAGLERAAQAFNPDVLGGAFAVALTPQGPVRLPLPAPAGR